MRQRKRCDVRTDIKSLELKNFKNHEYFLISFDGHDALIEGKNGEGKSSFGEGVTWVLYGVDTLGSAMNKGLSPEPTNYDYDTVEVHLIISIDGKDIKLSRILDGGTTKYYINDIPKKAKEYEAFVAELFDKRLFLSLFSPAYFFSLKMDEQRAMLLQYVQQPANKEVLAKLPAPQADKLAAELKKASLEELEAKHRDNKNKKDKALIAAKERVKTLREQSSGERLTDDEMRSLAAELKRLDGLIADRKEQAAEAREHNAKIDDLKRRRDRTYDQANRLVNGHKALKSQELTDTCTACGQPLTKEALAHATQVRMSQLDDIRADHSKVVAEYKEITAQLQELQPVELESDEGVYIQRLNLIQQLDQAEAARVAVQKIEEAERAEQEIHDSYSESVFLLDAIKAFKAAAAELMAEKTGALFPTLSLKLFEENKGDGERKPHFEVEMDGKPYRKLSVGEKIRAGLELIQVLSKQSGVIAPCFIDNAESYTGDIATIGQAIVCRAVPGKELTITTLTKESANNG